MRTSLPFCYTKHVAGVFVKGFLIEYNYMTAPRGRITFQKALY